MEREKLMVIYPQKRQKGKERERLDQILSYALENTQAELFEDMSALWEGENQEKSSRRFAGQRLLFAVPLGKDGVNREYYEVLAWLRAGDRVLEGAVAGLIIDADSELFTKAAARELTVAANQTGCAFVGRPLVEGTASLDNFIVQAANMKTDRMGAYKNSARTLAEQVASFAWEKKEHPHLLVLTAGYTSSTMAPP